MEPDQKKNNLVLLLSLFFLSILLYFSLVKKELAAVGIEDGKVFAPAPEVTAEAYLVKIIGQDRVILKQREWKRLRPASLTKLLTAAVALDYLTPQEYIEFSPEAKNAGEKISSVAVGERLERNKVLLFAIVYSANDAASALAEAVGRKMSGETFEERLTIFRYLMNERAYSIGMLDSSFQNPTGLDQENHFSSAEDLARLSEYIWKVYPEIFRLSRIVETRITSQEDREHLVVNTNELLREFPMLFGGKTGFTDKAGGALILLYPLKNKEIAIIVILKSEDRFGDGKRIIEWLQKKYGV